MTYWIQVMHGSTPDAWPMALDLFSRVASFATEHEPNKNPQQMIYGLQQNFVSWPPVLLGFLVMKDDRSVGHILCDMFDDSGLPTAFIRQIAIDRDAKIPRADVRRLVGEFKRFLAKFGVKRLAGIAEKRSTARLYRMFYGLEEAGIYVSTMIGGEEHGRRQQFADDDASDSAGAESALQDDGGQAPPGTVGAPVLRPEQLVQGHERDRGAADDVLVAVGSAPGPGVLGQNGSRGE